MRTRKLKRPPPETTVIDVTPTRIEVVSESPFRGAEVEAEGSPAGAMVVAEPEEVTFCPICKRDEFHAAIGALGICKECIALGKKVFSFAKLLIGR